MSSSPSSDFGPRYCSLCDEYFLTKEGLQIHIQGSRRHPRCITCKRSYLNMNSLRNVSPSVFYHWQSLDCWFPISSISSTHLVITTVVPVKRALRQAQVFEWFVDLSITANPWLISYFWTAPWTISIPSRRHWWWRGRRQNPRSRMGRRSRAPRGWSWALTTKWGGIYYWGR